jgi:hypothetical protein
VAPTPGGVGGMTGRGGAGFGPQLQLFSNLLQGKRRARPAVRNSSNSRAGEPSKREVLDTRRCQTGFASKDIKE